MGAAAGASSPTLLLLTRAMPAAKPMPEPAPAPARSGKDPGTRDALAAKKGSSKVAKLRAAFGSRKQPPQREEFAAKLEPAAAKRFESTRAWLTKQRGVVEDLHFYGATAGWGLRYTAFGHPVCALFIAGENALAVASLDAASDEAVEWEELSEATRSSRQLAQGNAAHMWVDVPLDAKGHIDLRTVVKARLATLADR